MAQLEVHGDSLRLTLTKGEKLAGLLRDLSVPLSSVRSAEVVDDQVRAVRGIRSPGLGLPWRKIGTWRRGDGRTIAVARSGSPGVRVQLDATGSPHGDQSRKERRPLRELIVDVTEPERVAAEINGAIR